MDLLKSLNLEDLPEQQTRTSQLTEILPDFQLNLGFDACCACGKSNPSFECEGCHRVEYCSKECRRKDTTPPTDEEEQALGHTSVVCAILGLCNDDETVENGEQKLLEKDKRNAAIDRLASEFESYPATLANVVMDGPCYQDILHKRSGDKLTIHIVGASVDSELWEGHPEASQERNVFKCYAEALAEIVESYKLKEIQLQFIGPECPNKDIDDSFPVPPVRKPKSIARLKVMTIKENYNEEVLKRRGTPPADIVVFFNPGFTCPDYSWDDALTCVGQSVPVLITTNTELEGVADLQYLLDRDLIHELPAGLAEMLQNGNAPGGSEEDSDAFFSVNPYSGNRVRQSGTMANDLYVKSRWIFGGAFGKPSEKESNANDRKKQKIDGSGNSKKLNPALV